MVFFLENISFSSCPFCHDDTKLLSSHFLQGYVSQAIFECLPNPYLAYFHNKKQCWVGIHFVCNHPWFWLVSIQLILSLIFRSKTRIGTIFLKKLSNPTTNTQMFYLCVDLKMGIEIYTGLWKKWLEPGVNSDPIYQTNTGIDPVPICF